MKLAYNIFICIAFLSKFWFLVEKLIYSKQYNFLNGDTCPFHCVVRKMCINWSTKLIIKLRKFLYNLLIDLLHLFFFFSQKFKRNRIHAQYFVLICWCYLLIYRFLFYYCCKFLFTVLTILSLFNLTHEMMELRCSTSFPN